MPEQAAISAALGPEDYKVLYGMLTSADESARSQGQALAKKLTPGEQQDFFAFQRQETTGKGEVGRPDASLGGLPPEFAVTGALGMGRALAGAGTGLAAKWIAVGKEAISQAAPFVKYEATKGALKSVGVPDLVAEPIAFAVAGYRKGGKAAPAEATPAAAPSVPETVAAPRARATRAASPSSPESPAMGSAADLAQLQGEMHRLIASGKSKEEALALIEQQLQLQQKLGLPSLAAVRQSVAYRNEKGDWPKGPK